MQAQRQLIGQPQIVGGARNHWGRFWPMGGSAASSAARSSLPPPPPPAGRCLVPLSRSTRCHTHPESRLPHRRHPVAGGTHSSGLSRRETKENGATFEPFLREARTALRAGACAWRRKSRKQEVSCFLLSLMSGTAKGYFDPPDASWSGFLFLTLFHPGLIVLGRWGCGSAPGTTRDVGQQAPEQILIKESQDSCKCLRV